MAASTPTSGASPSVGVHPEVARFEKEFDRTLIPWDVAISINANSISGERPNPDSSRLGFSFGLLFALLIGGGVVVWVPVLNIIWGLTMLAMIVALPIFGARAALFRFRRGRAKRFRIEFSGDGPPRWECSDDEFWGPVMDFFKL
jgi:hypothetical protein